jgi:1,4-dihydroxy-2-naphthoyl-CoA synthase
MRRMGRALRRYYELSSSEMIVELSCTISVSKFLDRMQITINRPEKRNAFRPRTGKAIQPA